MCEASCYICSSFIRVYKYVLSVPKLTTELLYLTNVSCVRFIWVGSIDLSLEWGILVIAAVVLSFRAMDVYLFAQWNRTFYFNRHLLDSWSLDESIYCYVEEYCAVFWSVLSVYVYLLFVRVSLRVKSCHRRGISLLQVMWPQSH